MPPAQLAAKMVAARVWGIDTDSRKYPTALSYGIQACAKSFVGRPGTLFDVMVDFAGVGFTTTGGIKAAEIEGTVELVGLGKKECTFDTFEFVATNVVIRGSTGSSLDEVQKCMDLMAEGKFAAGTGEDRFQDNWRGNRETCGGQCDGKVMGGILQRSDEADAWEWVA